MKRQTGWQGVLAAVSISAVLCVLGSCPAYATEDLGAVRKPVPMIHATDLFRPHNDPDDHWDLVCVFALAQQGFIDLKGILIDSPPVERNADYNPDVMAVAQMNFITGLHVPVAVGSPHPMASRHDTQPQASVSDHGGIQMVLDILATSDQPVVINVIGSCRDIAMAANQAPDLFNRKCAGIYLNAGTGSPDKTKAAQLEYNVSLAPHSYAALFDVPCPVFWMPCFEEMASGKNVMEYGTHYTFRQDQILPDLSNPLQNVFLSMLDRRQDQAWLAYLKGPVDEGLLKDFGAKDRHMWCTGGFFHAAGLAVTRTGEILPRHQAGDTGVLSFDPIKVACSDTGVTQWTHDAGSKDRSIFHVRDIDHYQSAMTQGMKTLLQGLSKGAIRSEAQAPDKDRFEMHPIGRIQKKDARTFIVLDKAYEPGMKGLEKHEYVIVIYWFDKNDTPEKRAILQVHPRGDNRNPLTGVFATHAPFRPNLIAVTQCDIIGVQQNVIEIKEIDAFDGSPVLDLKGDFFRFN
ncbi:MAG: tRNA (N6-threonylcarbamoyladenosine(37)-N6)-methyltransferase TrmO [Phycisphaerae bacterium]|nr:tRNA (N6-threonylcarbamoyladenosine(37)-N6)-methyltransferase TrmO [Phycisphaerae bacterium]